MNSTLLLCTGQPQRALCLICRPNAAINSAYLAVQQPEQRSPTFYCKEVKHRSSVRAKTLPEAVHLEICRETHFRIKRPYSASLPYSLAGLRLGTTKTLLPSLSRKRARYVNVDERVYSRLLHRSATIGMLGHSRRRFIPNIATAATLTITTSPPHFQQRHQATTNRPTSTLHDNTAPGVGVTTGRSFSCIA